MYPSPTSRSVWSRSAIAGISLKNSFASSTVISSTSNTFFFLYFTLRVSLSNLFPSHTSHVTYTVGKKCISTAIIPRPSHDSQRPPFTLNENRFAFHPRRRASSVSANMSRICPHDSVYVATFERGVRPIGLWSMRIARERYSRPRNCAQLYILFVRYFLSNCAERFDASTSSIKLDFPAPETPVIHTSRPSGMSIFTLSMLCTFAPMIWSLPLSASRRFSGISIFASPRKYASVRDFEGLVFAVSKSSIHPAAMTFPPCTPAAGPMSTI